jgi:hypothetical protein
MMINKLKKVLLKMMWNLIVLRKMKTQVLLKQKKEFKWDKKFNKESIIMSNRMVLERDLEIS